MWGYCTPNIGIKEANQGITHNAYLKQKYTGKPIAFDEKVKFYNEPRVNNKENEYPF